jgi:hypothetical protein
LSNNDLRLGGYPTSRKPSCNIISGRRAAERGRYISDSS